MKSIYLLLLVFLPFNLLAQLNESFADGDFSANPAWTGDVGDWVVNGGLLQSNNTIANSTFYLSTANNLSTTTQWEFFIRLNFNTSSTNYVDVYLIASASNLTLPGTSGYFVRIGSTQDDVCLFRKDANGSSTKIIDGVDGVTNSTDNKLRIKVTRDASSQFTLLRDASGTGNNYFSEGSVTDASFNSSSFFGFLVKQSTSSFFQKHYFDDIQIHTYVPDNTPPSVASHLVVSANSMDVLFSEPVDVASSQAVTSYMADNGLGVPVSATRDATNNALIHLVFTNNFVEGINNSLTITGVKDLAGNALSNAVVLFSYFTVHQFDIVIDEIMADPTPPAALPETEFIEIKNTSGKVIDVTGWKLSTSSASSGSFPAMTLPPDSFLIICPASSVSQFNPYGKVLGVTSFPALPNEGGLLSLASKDGKTIHAVEYSKSWYNNAAKEDGGWTIEMTDVKNPCSGSSNWKASTHPNGGTPGKINSGNAKNPDTQSPRLVRTYSIDSVTIVALFDEPLDSNTAATTSNYALTNNSIVFAKPLPPLFNMVILGLSKPMQKRTVYDLSVSSLQDCAGNKIVTNKVPAGLAEDAAVGDIVINEVLFNPRPNAYDYLEFYNRSDKVINATSLLVGNRNSGTIGSFKKLNDTPFFIFPGQYLVVTESLASLKTMYLVEQPQNVLTLSSLPSLPDDKGDVLLTNIAGDIIDEIVYEDDWHFALLADDEGVALERIDPGAPSQNKTNWHSAATSAGYGTPTYRNSQYKQNGGSNAAITLAPKIFSPDNDGYDDVVTISYQLSEPGYMANVSIFDAAGRMVRYLVKNELLGLKGGWNWDGLGEKMQKLPIGTYVIYSEIFNLQGNKKHFKEAIVLARKI